jgi:hypothetical protein
MPGSTQDLRQHRRADHVLRRCLKQVTQLLDATVWILALGEPIAASSARTLLERCPYRRVQLGLRWLRCCGITAEPPCTFDLPRQITPPLPELKLS